jgi:rhodanese-related sulfurtransferase
VSPEILASGDGDETPDAPEIEGEAVIVTQVIQFQRETIQSKVFNLLKDQLWHCREHEGNKIASTQYAGGGGIQGLQRGSGARPGLEIEQKNELCPVCKKITRWDRWTGGIKEANAAANIPSKLVEKIMAEYAYEDVIEQRVRAKHELVIDHRFPMERWGQKEIPNSVAMTPDEIRKKFQLLKKDAAGNHNLLKSRACERCIATGKRGTPFGIEYWYAGDENWTVPVQRGPEAEQGCVGCGWYDFDIWRTSLNQRLRSALVLAVLNQPEGQ